MSFRLNYFSLSTVKFLSALYKTWGSHGTSTGLVESQLWTSSRQFKNTGLNHIPEVLMLMFGKCNHTLKHTSRARISKFVPPIREGVPGKHLSITSSSKPTASKICAPYRQLTTLCFSIDIYSKRNVCMDWKPKHVKLKERENRNYKTVLALTSIHILAERTVQKAVTKRKMLHITC